MFLSYSFFSVRVLDENDNSPLIHTPQSIEITEYHDVNDIIMSVKVTDADDPNTLNGKTSIQLINEIENGNLNSSLTVELKLFQHFTFVCFQSYLVSSKQIPGMQMFMRRNRCAGSAETTVSLFK